MKIILLMLTFWNNVWLCTAEGLKKTTMNISRIFYVLIVGILSFSCSESLPGPVGPQGPRGPQGPQGADGESAFVFEWENVNFVSPDYEIILPYPETFQGLDSDVALVYVLWDSYETNDGEIVEVWKSLPFTVLKQEGTLIYQYDFSKYDVRLFLEADFSLDFLGAIDTDEWVVRVVVVPGNFWDGGRVDTSDYDQVAEMLGLPDLTPDHVRSVSRSGK